MKWTVNKIGIEGARMLSESLKINSTLTKLNVRSDRKKTGIKKNKKKKRWNTRKKKR